jgi:hypothetical protein
VRFGFEMRSQIGTALFVSAARAAYTVFSLKQRR